MINVVNQVLFKRIDRYSMYQVTEYCILKYHKVDLWVIYDGFSKMSR